MSKRFLSISLVESCVVTGWQVESSRLQTTLIITVPLIVRLQGTNAEEGKAILDQSGLDIETAILFKEAADKVNEALSGTGVSA